MILPADVFYLKGKLDLQELLLNDKKCMKKEKVFCSKCKYKFFGIEGYFCKAGKIYGNPIHHNDTYLREAYDERSWFNEKEMEELNKNNNCSYYEKDI
jgi:hypothetical protein